MIEKRKRGSGFGRLLLAAAAAVVATGASWVNPPPTPPAPASRGVEGATAIAGAEPPLTVSAWEFSRVLEGRAAAVLRFPGGPLYLRFEVRGGERATAALRAQGSLPIEVHWTPPAGAAPSAPALMTEMRVGRPDLVQRLAGETRRTGSFLWHMWAQKTTLSPGSWTVSLTYPDGRPLACAPAGPPRSNMSRKTPNEPCRFTIDIG